MPPRLAQLQILLPFLAPRPWLCGLFGATGIPEASHAAILKVFHPPLYRGVADANVRGRLLWGLVCAHPCDRAHAVLCPRAALPGCGDLEVGYVPAAVHDEEFRVWRPDVPWRAQVTPTPLAEHPCPRRAPPWP